MTTNGSFDEILCAQCRGRCCQGHPGVWSEPQRFFQIFFAGKIPSATELGSVLAAKRLRLREVGDILIPAPQENEKGCGFLQKDGCELPVAERPCQCLALIPVLETLVEDQIQCRMPPEFGSGSARENWRPFQTLLRKISR